MAVPAVRQDAHRLTFSWRCTFGVSDPTRKPPCDRPHALRVLNREPILNLLDRHLFKGVLFTCAAAVGLFVFVLVLGNAIKDLLTPVITGQLGWGMVVRLLVRLLPAVAPFALPIGMLTGILLTLGRLSADSE